MRHGGYAQPRFFDEKLLQGVKSANPFFGVDGMRAQRAGDLPYPHLEHLLEILCRCALSKGVGADPVFAVR